MYFWLMTNLIRLFSNITDLEIPLKRGRPSLRNAGCDHGPGVNHGSFLYSGQKHNDQAAFTRFHSSWENPKEPQSIRNRPRRSKERPPTLPTASPPTTDRMTPHTFTTRVWREMAAGYTGYYVQRSTPYRYPCAASIHISILY